MMNAHAQVQVTDPASTVLAQPTIEEEPTDTRYTAEPLPTHFMAPSPQQAESIPRLPSYSPDTLPGRLQAFLSKNLDARITLKELSRFLGYSEKYASEFFRSQMGVCFSHHLKRLRITEATRMLNDHGLSISHIAESLGFSDAFAFSHFFKRAVGCSPTEFRKQQAVHAGLR